MKAGATKLGPSRALNDNRRTDRKPVGGDGFDTHLPSAAVISDYSALRVLVKNNLRASKQRNRLAAGLALHLGIPDLCGASAVQQPRLAGYCAVKSGADEVGFELDRGEPCGAFRKRRDAAVAARRICKCNDRRGMKISVRSQMLFADFEPTMRKTVTHINPIKPQMVGQVSCLFGAEGRGCIIHAHPRRRIVATAAPAEADPNFQARAARC